MQQERAQPYVPKPSRQAPASGPSSPAIRHPGSGMSTITAHVAASHSTQSEDNQSPRSLQFPPVSMRGTSLASQASGSVPPSLPKDDSQAKKKRSSVFSFFTVKEPSTQAWLDYQENLRKQQPTRHGRVSAVGLPMVSCAKLPPTVPKVNSRWNGLPDLVVQREKEKKAKRRAAHSHPKHLSNNTLSVGRSVSRSSSQSSGSGQPAPGSTLSFSAPPLSSDSAASSRNDLPWTPSSADARDFSTIFGKAMNARPETPLSGISSFVPHIPISMESREDLHRSRFSGSIDLPEPPRFNASPTSTPSEASPSTPQFNSSFITPFPLDIDPSTKVRPSQIQRTVLALPLRQEKVVLHSTGPNILDPPMSSRRKMKGSAFQAGDTPELQMPESQPGKSRPGSVLSREATLRKTPDIARPSISDYFSSNQQRTLGPDVRLDIPEEAPTTWPTSVGNLVERDDPERFLTPPPRASKAPFRKSKLPFFRS
ncbi:hypothetical protein MMC26_007312 [Xylographa opegraphella]|nr:hypothetical protein [Xylographa opegraphella]